MQGWKMVAARRAAARLVDTLLPDDRFSVVAFDDQMEVFQLDDTSSGPLDGDVTLVPGTDRNRFAALSWIAGIQARGYTEMRRPLVEAVQVLAASSTGREPVVVLVTDGQIGAEAQLLTSVEPLLGRTRFCIVGIDSAPNTSLPERLQRRSNGYVTFVESEDRLDEALVNLHRRIGRPDLLSLTVTAQGVEIIPDDTAPGSIVDVFSGVPCRITGRYRHSGTNGTTGTKFTLSATKADDTGVFTATIAPTTSTAKGISDAWARARIADLEDDYDARRTDPTSARAAITELSIRSRVLSRFTAFVAIDDEDQEIASTRDMTQPVEPPAGWGMNTSMNYAAGSNAFAGALGAHAIAGASLLRSHATTFTAANTGQGPSYVPPSRLTRGSSNLRTPDWTNPTFITPGQAPTYPGVPGAQVVVPAVSLLLECLARLRVATDGRSARLVPLVRQLRQLRDMSLATVITALQGCIDDTTSVYDTIAVVEQSLQSLRSVYPATVLTTRPRTTPREFWS
jgi:hypothetical protein